MTRGQHVWLCVYTSWKEKKTLGFGFLPHGDKTGVVSAKVKCTSSLTWESSQWANSPLCDTTKCCLCRDLCLNKHLLKSQVSIPQLTQGKKTLWGNTGPFTEWLTLSMCGCVWWAVGWAALRAGAASSPAPTPDCPPSGRGRRAAGASWETWAAATALPPARRQTLTSWLVTGGEDCRFVLFVSRLKGSSGDAQGKTAAEA